MNAEHNFRLLFMHFELAEQIALLLLTCAVLGQIGGYELGINQSINQSISQSIYQSISTFIQRKLTKRPKCASSISHKVFSMR
jgi:hypothetical protein